MPSSSKFIEIYLPVAQFLLPPLILATVGLIYMAFKLVKSKAALKVRLDAAEASNISAKQIIATLQDKVRDEQSQRRPYTDRDTIRANWQVDEPSHTYVEPSSGHHYCLPCLEKTPPEIHLLEPLEYGFVCRTCGQAFRDPTKPPPEPSPSPYAVNPWEGPVRPERRW